MSKYAKMDEEILNLIKNGCCTASSITARTRKSCEEIAPGRDPYRVVDGRLQYLRKQGTILYRSQAWFTSLS